MLGTSTTRSESEKTRSDLKVSLDVTTDNGQIRAHTRQARHFAPTGNVGVAWVNNAAASLQSTACISLWRVAS